MGRKKQQGSSSSSAAVAATESSKAEEMEKRRGGSSERRKGRVERKEENQREKGGDGRKERQEKQTTTEEGNPTATAQFFKVFFPQQSAVQLKIPQAFKEYVDEDHPNRAVSLRGPSGNTWQVLLTSDSQGLAFTEGWKEFARDHSLVPGQFLVFTYDGHSQFSVTVFGLSGIRDKSALRAQPREEAAHMAEASAPPVKDNGARKKRSREVNHTMENDTASKRHTTAEKKRVQRTPAANIIDTSKATPTTAIKSDNGLLGEDSSCNMTRMFKSKDLPRIGKFVSKKFRQPVIISQRRQITEEEKNLAIKRAKEFKSKHPFTVQIMMESYVYVGFFLNIPCEFVRESLPRTSKKMTLWDPQGKSWQVNYVYYTDRSVAAFSGGWGKFAIGNNLEKFDVCVFELFKEDNIKVHIYRVVPEITPLLRSSSM